jgi:3-keto-5-aminohexanoate cleavage enzyme
MMPFGYKKRESEMYPLIINAAISGALHPSKSEYLPKNPEQIGEEALACADAGASIVHIHARDDDGIHSGKLEHFARALRVIRDARSEVIVNFTTSFGGSAIESNDLERRMSVLDLSPELASFDAGTLNFGDHVFMNDPAFLRQLAARMKERNVKPEIEIFDDGMLGTTERLIAAGLIDEPPFYQFVLGVPGGARATPENLVHLVRSLPKDALWSVAAVGRDQLRFNAMAIAMGGHARTGLEDNLYYSKGELATNAQLVARVRTLAEIMGREVASPAQARGLLALATPVL